jgi:hypothetical protein
MTIFRSIVDDGECANLRGQPEIIRQLQRGMNNPSKRFVKVSESNISRFGDGYDGSSTRQMASSLGGKQGLERGK